LDHQPINHAELGRMYIKNSFIIIMLSLQMCLWNWIRNQKIEQILARNIAVKYSKELNRTRKKYYDKNLLVSNCTLNWINGRIG
jgi:hypothetical protein